ncbi:EAL domain-containing protein [Halomonas nitroreducens]|uniref:EAL domain-containing protein n=1 Tax=Halomonas nitroreducens TaxID=447425 RepID=A0A431V3S3_9GAMM|nr:EAL domain-containing protein [Halomonas nitroreducens]RTR04960.1 EAL domain-containing protein [Halomonas nitroreducens]
MRLGPRGMWWLGLLVLLFGAWPALAAAQAPPARMLVLASYHSGNPWTNELVERIDAAAERLALPALDVDYLDARRLGEAEAFRLELSRLEGRRAVSPADRLLLLDDAAVRFYLQHVDALGEPSRVVALGVNDDALRRRAVARGVKLILYPDLASESLRFLADAFGGPLPVLVLGDRTPVGVDLTTDFLASLSRAEAAHAVDVLWDWTPASVTRALADLPADTRVYLVEGQTTGAGDLDLRRRGWLPDLQANGIPVFCHLPYQVALGCSGGAILDTRRLGTLAVEALVSPAFARLPARQAVGAGRRVLDARWSGRVPARLASRVEWLAVGATLQRAELSSQRLLWASVGVGGVLAGSVLVLAWSRGRAQRARRQLMVDRLTGLPTRQVLESDFDNAQAARDGWMFELSSPMLRDYRVRLGLPAAQAMFLEQLALIREAMPPHWSLYAGSGFNLLGVIPDGQDVAKGEQHFDAMLARLDGLLRTDATHRLAWHASLLRLGGHRADVTQCCAALDDGLVRLERQGWRQPVMPVEPLAAQAATRFRRLADAIETLIAAPEAQWRLVLQPKVRPSDHALLGVEALIRWRHPQLGDIAPGEFLPVVESLGHSARLDRWVMETSLAWLEAHRDRLSTLPSLAINVNLATLESEGFLLALAAQLEARGLPPQCLELEVTEHADFSDLTRVEAVLDRLHDLGVRVALDDFGTGYTAFQLLQRLPFDVVKLDRTLLLAAGEHGRAFEAYEAMVRFCRQLGLDVVAEGVETSAQATWLAGQDIQALQGFGLARPLELDDYLARYAGGGR